MNYIFFALCLFGFTGCKCSVDKDTDSPSIPALHRIDNVWSYQGKSMKQTDDLAGLIQAHPRLHIIAPAEMPCKYLQKIWMHAKRAKSELLLSVEGSHESPQVLYIVDFKANGGPEIEPMFVFLKNEGIQVNREALSREEFQTRVTDFSTLAKSAGLTPRFQFAVDDEAHYRKLVQLLALYSEYQFEIDTSGFEIPKPATIDQPELKPLSPSDLKLFSE